MSIFELIEAGDARGARKLLADDASLASARDDRGLSALMRASYRGGDVYAAVREAEPELDAWDRIVVGEAADLPAADAWSPDGFTPLHIAAFAKNAAAAQALVDAGADVNAFATASFARVTPLGTCAFVGATEVARVLLRAGADPTLTEIEGGSPLEAAMHNGHRDLVSLLVVLTAHGYAGAIRTALDQDPALANATVDWGGGDWESALGAASHVGNREIAELLLDHGARLDVFAAAMLEMVDVVRAALEARPDLRDALGPHGIPLRAHAKGGVAELF
jgi:ankyrin repeat protein